jgi:pyridoxal phosphate enzyme (YggS family)
MESAVRVGRDPGEINLIAVSKGRPVELILAAAEAGQLVFGENRAQELRDKLKVIEKDLEWHFIGHLQRNKVNMVVGNVVLIHSVDSRRLMEAIDLRAKELGIVQDVLLQVNVSGEASKHGVSGDDASRLLEVAFSLEGVRVRGLMTIAPLQDAGEKARVHFTRLRELRDMLVEEYKQADLGILSMGMTQDYEVAVEEGANMVRVGTAIFRDE